MWVLTCLEQKARVDGAARRCPACGNPRGRKHGRVLRRVRDWQHAAIVVQRMRCPACGATWTVYPRGMAPYRQRSQRVRELGVLLYMLGLSYRQVSQVLASMGVPVSPPAVLGDVMAAGERAQERNRQLRGRVRQVGIDGTGVPMAGVGSVGVVVAVDVERQQVLLVEAVEERDAEAVRELLEEVIAGFAPQEVVTDEAAPYGVAVAEAVVEEEGMRPRHRLCAAHFRRNKARRLRELEREAEGLGAPLLALEAAALRALLRAPPGVLGEAAWRWYWRQYAWLREGEGRWARWRWRMKLLLLELMEKGPQVTGITNNAAEGAIGRVFKVRMKSMRGMKRAENRDRYLNLAVWMDRQRRCPVARLAL